MKIPKKLQITGPIDNRTIKLKINELIEWLEDKLEYPNLEREVRYKDGKKRAG